MPKATMVAFTVALPGRREALDLWYDEHHVPDLLSVSGVIGAQRYDLRAIKLPNGFPEMDFLGLYALSGDDIDEIVAEMGVRMAAGQKCQDLDSDKTVAFLAYERLD